MTKHIIWSNRNLDNKDWKEFFDEYYPDVTDEYEKNQIISDLNYDYLEDEKMNLDIEVEGRILVIGDLGLWDGRKSAYKILGKNIKDILCSEFGGFMEWYSDGQNIKGIEGHHDGTNYYKYRIIREDRNIDNLLDDIYYGNEISRAKLNYYTRSLHPYVAKVYGW